MPSLPLVQFLNRRFECFFVALPGGFSAKVFLLLTTLTVPSFRSYFMPHPLSNAPPEEPFPPARLPLNLTDSPPTKYPLFGPPTVCALNPSSPLSWVCFFVTPLSAVHCSLLGFPCFFSLFLQHCVAVNSEPLTQFASGQTLSIPFTAPKRRFSGPSDCPIEEKLSFPPIFSPSGTLQNPPLLIRSPYRRIYGIKPVSFGFRRSPPPLALTSPPVRLCR